jgi:hypothetical protein
MPSQVLVAYGLRIASPLPLPGAAPSDEPADVSVVLHPTAAEVEARWSGHERPAHISYRRVDGRILAYHRGVDGDVLLRWGGDGTWVIDRARARVDAHSPEDPPAPAWQRVLMDSVLGSVALGRGAEALHAGAVVIGDAAVAVLGDQGAGKTSLLAALLERGHTLVADDVLVLAGPDTVHPGPPVLNHPGVPPPALGTPVATLGDETWVHIRAVADGPVPLRALILLDRREDGPETPELRPEPQPFVPLFAQLLPSNADEDARFALVADLIARVDVLRLSARSDGATAARLAELIEAL